MAPLSVLVATTSQSLATFIKRELSETTATIHLLTDPEQFFKKLKAMSPSLILLDINYPTQVETADLIGKLQQKSAWREIPLVIIKTFFEPLDESLLEIPEEQILTQPFTRADLLTILQQASDQPITNHRPDDEEEMMTESTSTVNEQEPLRTTLKSLSSRKWLKKACHLISWSRLETTVQSPATAAPETWATTPDTDTLISIFPVMISLMNWNCCLTLLHPG